MSRDGAADLGGTDDLRPGSAVRAIVFQLGRVKRAGKKKSFIERNADSAAPTTGVMTMQEVQRFLQSLIQTVSELEALGEADYDELVGELLSLVVTFGGEERNYVDSRTVVICVGGTDYSVTLQEVAQAVQNCGMTLRSFTRAYAAAVIRILQQEDMRDYFKQTYGNEVDPLVIRSDLLHSDYAYKFDGKKVVKFKKSKLSSSDGNDGDGPNSAGDGLDGVA